MSSKFSLPTEMVELPSKGLLYPEDSPLAKGVVEMKYMTAKEEDILTNQNYINQGIVIDKLLQSLLVDKSIKYNDLLIGDKNAIMIAARILSYGSTYPVYYMGETVEVDLSKIENKPIDKDFEKAQKNEFNFTLPVSKNKITFRILTAGDETSIENEIKGLKKLDQNVSPEVTTRLKYTITSVSDSKQIGDIRDFVDNYLLAQDSRALRKEYSRIMPDIDLTFEYTNKDGGKERVGIPIGLDFFWPNEGI
jgi:hypothetical protein